MSIRGTLGSVITRKTVGVAIASALVASSLVVLAVPASALSPSQPTITFSGNSLATSVPATETANRIGDTLAVATLSLSRTAATTRTGYTFGGWSLAVGEAATNSITTATTSDTSRTIHAVWNTTITYDLNGSTSGTLDGGKTQDTYRFGQTLTLPVSGTLARTGYTFGGWLPASSTGTRSTTYTAASTATGTPTLYAAWIRSVSFNGNGSTSGTVPSPLTYLAGGVGVTLPIYSEMTLRKTGQEFVGWATTANGPALTTSTFVPTIEAQTLFAVWKPEVISSTKRVFFKFGKSVLRSDERYELRLLRDRLVGKKNINIVVTSTRPKGAPRKLGTARNKAVIQYLESLGIAASYSRVLKEGISRIPTSTRNNRVTVKANWVN